MSISFEVTILNPLYVNITYFVKNVSETKKVSEKSGIVLYFKKSFRYLVC